MGLDNTKFGTVRSTIISSEPLPKLSQVYQRVIWEERQQTILKSRNDRPDAFGFTAQTTTNQRSESNLNQLGFRQRSQSATYHDVSCTHYGKVGHEVSECYQTKGYPDWWGERGRNFGDRGTSRGRGRGGGVVGGFGSGRGRGFSPRANAVQVSGVSQVATAAHTTRREGDYDRSSLPQLSDDQWTALL